MLRISVSLPIPGITDILRNRLVLRWPDAIAPEGEKSLPPFSKYALTRICIMQYIRTHGICFRNHCGAEPPRHLEPAVLFATIGRTDRAPAPHAATHSVQAPARAARGRFRGVHHRRTAPSLQLETRSFPGTGRLAGAIPPVLVGACRCSGALPRPHGSI